jgi:hypothetical protein
MNAAASGTAWLQISLRTVFAFVLVVAAFFAGWSVAERRADQAIHEARQAAALARQQAEEARSELDREERSLRMERMIPCHPGCFPAGTLVRVPQGTAPIERLREGDRVITIGADGTPTPAQVHSVFITRNRLINVRTDRGTLETTQTQPVCLQTGELRAAGELKAGDILWRWDGAGRQAATVRNVSQGRIAQVFNLVLGDPTVFIAVDFLVRSKPPAAGSASAP